MFYVYNIFIYFYFQDQIPDLNTYFCCHYIACLSAIASSRYMIQDFEKNLNPFVSLSTLSATIVQLDNLPSNINDFVIYYSI